MDIKAQINKIVDTIQKDKTLFDQFQKEPVKVVEKLVGIDLPDDIVNNIILGVKGKISADKVNGVLGSLKKLF